MSSYNKPLPEISDENRGFWEATASHELRLQKCISCRHIRYPVAAYCPVCLSEDFEWSKVSGRGKVFSYVVFHQVYHAGFKDDVPYNVAMIELDEGPRLISNIVGVEERDVAANTPVEVVFDQVTDEITLPRFRLVDGS